MKLALGADHRGLDMLDDLAEHLRVKGHEVETFSCPSGKSCDYPDHAWGVGTAVSNGGAERGILVCGSGIGMTMAANKISGVRAALVHDEIGAEMSRAHNDANVLCLSGDLIDERDARKIVDAWLKRDFDGGRHARRVRKIQAIERGESPGSVAEES